MAKEVVLLYESNQDAVFDLKKRECSVSHCINSVMVQFRHVNEIGFFTVMDESRYHHGTNDCTTNRVLYLLFEGEKWAYYNNRITTFCCIKLSGLQPRKMNL